MSEFTFELLTRALDDRVWKKKGIINYISILSQKLIPCLSIWLYFVVIGVHLQTNKQKTTVSQCFMLPASSGFFFKFSLDCVNSLLIAFLYSDILISAAPGGNA